MDSSNNLKLADIFEMVKQFFVLYFSSIKINIVLILLSFTICLSYYAIEKNKFEANSSFVLMEGGANKSGSLSNIGSQFGIDLGSIGGQSNSIFSGDNIFDIFKTRSIVEKVLLSPYKSEKNEQKFTLADQYLIMYPSLIRNVKIKKENSTFFYNYNASVNPERIKDSILFRMYDKIVKKNLSIQRINKKGSIIQVSVLTNDEYFSKIFNERLIEEAKTFYLNINNANTQKVLIGLQNKSDSLQRLLFQKSYQSAGLLNANTGLKAYSANEEISQKDKTVAYTMFSEVVKNIELTKMSQAQQTPIFQILDMPKFPLENKKMELFDLSIFAILIGLALTFLHAFVKYIFL